jgi:hypothetical protein
MNVEIGAEAAQFPEKEYINGIAVAVQNKPLQWYRPQANIMWPGSPFKHSIGTVTQN